MIYVTFFIAKKVTKKSSRSKNSLNHSSICFVFWLAASLVPVSLTPLLGFKAKKRPSGSLKQFRATGF